MHRQPAARGAAACRAAVAGSGTGDQQERTGGFRGIFFSNLSATVGLKLLGEDIILYFMAAAYLPSVLVPLVGLVFPAIAMASLFIYIEKEEIA